MDVLGRRISSCSDGFEERADIVRGPAHILSVMSDLMTGPADELPLRESVHLSECCVHPHDLEIVHVDDGYLVIEAVEHGSEKLVRTLKLPRPFRDALFERFIQEPQFLFGGHCHRDRIAGEINHGKYEDRAAEEDGAGDELGGKGWVTDHHNDEQHVGDHKEKHEDDHDAPAAPELRRNAAADLPALYDGGKHEQRAE